MQVAFLAYQMHLKAVCMALLHSVALELLYYVLNRRRGVCKEKKRDMRDQQTTETGTVVYYILCTPIIHKKGRVLMCCGYSASWLPWKHLKRRRERVLSTTRRLLHVPTNYYTCCTSVCHGLIALLKKAVKQSQTLFGSSVLLIASS